MIVLYMHYDISKQSMEQSLWSLIMIVNHYDIPNNIMRIIGTNTDLEVVGWYMMISDIPGFSLCDEISNEHMLHPCPVNHQRTWTSRNRGHGGILCPAALQSGSGVCFPDVPRLPSGELTFCHGKSPFLMGKSTISMAIFNCYVSLPEGIVCFDLYFFGTNGL